MRLTLYEYEVEADVQYIINGTSAWTSFQDGFELCNIVIFGMAYWDKLFPIFFFVLYERA